MYSGWIAPAGGGGTSEEMVLAFEHGSAYRLLVLPALFDEHNKTRRQTVEIMRRLSLSGIDCFLPDLPGCNESPAPLEEQDLAGWRAAAAEAAAHFAATHCLAIRGGALMLPEGLPAYAYAPVGGRQLLRAMIRARTIASREAGREETGEALMEDGRARGIELAGWRLSATMVRELETAEPRTGPNVRNIEQAEIGGPPLWLRAEPDEAPAQADALAAILAIGIQGQ